MKTIAKGAEANILLSKDSIIKHRIEKGYRLPALDSKIRKRRTKREAKILTKLQNIIPVPKLISSSDSDFKIQMSHIKGKKLSESLDSLPLSVSKQIGENLAILHDLGICHGDLTTSNMIYSNKKVFFIDFGLSLFSDKIEDKAVDLHLIKEALEAKHFAISDSSFKAILSGYKKSKNYQRVIDQLKKVEARGRYKRQG